MTELTVEVKKRLDAGEALHQIRSGLIGEGYLEKDIDEAVHLVSMEERSSKQIRNSTNSRLVTFKEIFDRLGYGFGSQQYLNILFFLTGGSIFLIGIINGIRSFLTMLLSSFVQDYSKVGVIKKRTMLWSGILFASTFLMIAVAKYLHTINPAFAAFSVPMFSLGLLFGGIFVVIYGDVYYNLVMSNLRKEHMTHFLKQISHYGLIITGVTLLIAGIIMDRLKRNGYIYVMLLAAICFLLSMVFLFFIRTEPIGVLKGRSLLSHIKIYFDNVKSNYKAFFKNRVVFVLLITGAITSIVQALGNSYYGIFIFRHLHDDGMGGFINVAIIFFVALISSYFGSMISQKNAAEYGKFPMLVFGTVLMAIMPLTYYYNPNIVSISMATVLGIIGGSVAGVARGLLSFDLIRDDMREKYFSISSVLYVFPYVIGIPLGALIAQNSGLQTLFFYLGLALILFVIPLYMLIIIWNHAKNKVQ